MAYVAVGIFSEPILMGEVQVAAKALERARNT